MRNTPEQLNDAALTDEEQRRRPTSRRLAALTLAAAGLTSSCSVPGMSFNGTPTAEVKIASWNVLYTNSQTNIVDGVQQLQDKGDADIIALQEVTKKAQRDLLYKDVLDCTTCTYDAYFAEINHGSELPIMWDTTVFEQIGEGERIVVHEKQFFDDGGAGGSEINDRHIVSVRLRHLATGQEIIVANTHILPSNQLEDREEFFNKHIAALKKFAENNLDADVPVFVAGDFNVDYRKAEYQKLFTDMGYEINWLQLGFPPKTGTHENSDRVIDAILLLNGQGVRPAFNSKWPDKNNSDHHPIYGIYRLSEIANELNDKTRN